MVNCDPSQSIERVWFPSTTIGEVAGSEVGGSEVGGSEVGSSEVGKNVVEAPLGLSLGASLGERLIDGSEVGARDVCGRLELVGSSDVVFFEVGSGVSTIVLRLVGVVVV